VAYVRAAPRAARDDDRAIEPSRGERHEEHETSTGRRRHKLGLETGRARTIALRPATNDISARDARGQSEMDGRGRIFAHRRDGTKDDGLVAQRTVYGSKRGRRHNGDETNAVGRRGEAAVWSPRRP